jgi:hypothetical protein
MCYITKQMQREREAAENYVQNRRFEKNLFIQAYRNRNKMYAFWVFAFSYRLVRCFLVITTYLIYAPIFLVSVEVLLLTILNIRQLLQLKRILFLETNYVGLKISSALGLSVSDITSIKPSS